MENNCSVFSLFLGATFFFFFCPENTHALICFPTRCSNHTHAHILMYTHGEMSQQGMFIICTAVCYRNVTEASARGATTPKLRTQTERKSPPKETRKVTERTRTRTLKEGTAERRPLVPRTPTPTYTSRSRTRRTPPRVREE